LVCGVGLTIPFTLHHCPCTVLLMLIVHIPKESFFFYAAEPFDISVTGLNSNFVLGQQIEPVLSASVPNFTSLKWYQKLNPRVSDFHIDLQLSTFIGVLDFDFYP
jgi:hypothetical protein